MALLHSPCPQRSVGSRGILRPVWSFLCASVVRGRFKPFIVRPCGMEIVGVAQTVLGTLLTLDSPVPVSIASWQKPKN